MRKAIYLSMAVSLLLMGTGATPAAATELQVATPLRHAGPAIRVLHLPDLVIQGVNFTPQHPCRPGAPALQADVTVQNVGKAASPAVSRAGMVQVRDTVGKNWGNGHALLALAPGQSTTVHIPIYYLQGDPGYMLGLHRFRVTVNAGKWVTESNYNNDVRMASVTMPAGFCGLRPDITSHSGPRIGGKSVPWGGSVTLGRRNAKRMQNGRCVFDFVYQMSNDGKADTTTEAPQFINRLREGRTVVAVNSRLRLKAGQTKTLDTETAMLPGHYTLGLSLDDGNAVVESNEGNNVFRVSVTVGNTCGTTLRRRVPTGMRMQRGMHTSMPSPKLNPQPEPPSHARSLRKLPAVQLR